MNLQPGDFIFHPNHGLAQILSNQQQTEESNSAIRGDLGDTITIRFRNGETKVYTRFLLERSWQKSSPDGFRVYSYLYPNETELMLRESPVEVIIRVLQDFPSRSAKNADLKEYLTPYIPDWENWWKKAQLKLKEDPRINTKKSRLREYGINRELHSRAEEIYQVFKETRQYNQARNALIEVSQNKAKLSPEHLQEIVDYLKFTVSSEQISHSIRLDALFRLEEGKWVSLEEFSKNINLLLQSDIRLFELEVYPLNRLVELLLKKKLSDRELSILASGICAGEKTISALLSWAYHESDTEFTRRLLTTALEENLPPIMRVNDYPSLQYRLETCISLVKSIEPDHSYWKEITGAFLGTVEKIAQHASFREIRFLLPSVLLLAIELYKGTGGKNSELGNDILSGLVMPTFTDTFILTLIDDAESFDANQEFTTELEGHLLSTVEKRSEGFLRVFIENQGDAIQRVAKLVYITNQFESNFIREQAGKLVCEILRQCKDVELIGFIPYLNQLYCLRGKWSWDQSLESLREKAYFSMFNEGVTTRYVDNAIILAAKQFSETNSAIVHKDLSLLGKELDAMKGRISELEGLLQEKETILKELRSGFGGDTADARFEERSRILKGFVGAIAEFERFSANQTHQSREIEAILRRLNSLLAGVQVSSMDAIGTLVAFNPQNHRLVDSEVAVPNDPVKIIERGYLIRDNNDKLRLLKRALVMK